MTAVSTLQATLPLSSPRPNLVHRALLGPVELYFPILSSTFNSGMRPSGASQIRPYIRTSYLTGNAALCNHPYRRYTLGRRSIFTRVSAGHEPSVVCRQGNRLIESDTSRVSRMDEEIDVAFNSTRVEPFESLSHPTRGRILLALGREPIGFSEPRQEGGLSSSGLLSFRLPRLNHLLERLRVELTL